MGIVQLRTGIWYDDRAIQLDFPDDWQVDVEAPRTPTPLSPEQISEAIDRPIGQEPIRKGAKGANRPLIITDDTTRPTPTFKVMPAILKQFMDAGIEPEQIRVLVATGTHGTQQPEALLNKLGKECWSRCRVIIHNDKRHTVKVGQTSYGTPVHVDREVAKSDYILGIGGIYPQFSTGFGGGGKLALGVMGRKTISHFHFNRPCADGCYNIHNEFRQDVTEAAQMIGLRSIVTVQPDQRLNVINLKCGDYLRYYDDMVAFIRQRFRARPPYDSNVVIANGYPSDVSYTAMQKANRPILWADPKSTRIMIASNTEGLGHHGLFPHGKSERYLQMKSMYDRAKIMPLGTVASKITRRVLAKLKVLQNSSSKKPAYSFPDDPTPANPLWIYTPPGETTELPPLPGVIVTREWNEILAAIRREQEGSDSIRVRLYACASLQCIDGEAEILDPQAGLIHYEAKPE